MELAIGQLGELIAGLGSLADLGSQLASAQFVQLSSQADYGGGVGNLVAAALQTKGLIDQAKILTDFKDILEWIAALGWLFSIMMGIGSVAVLGNYRTGLYLLLGPPLFYYMITTKIATDGTKVLMGDRPIAGAIEDQNRLLQWIGAIGGDLQNGDGGPQVVGGGTVQVSFFFGVFDTIVTELTQKIVSVIIDTDKRNDLRFVARERAKAFVLESVPHYGPLWTLAITEHFGQCGEAIAGLQGQEGKKDNAYLDPRPDTDIDSAEKRIKDHKWDDPSIHLSRTTVEFLIANKGSTTDAQGTKFPDVPFTIPEDYLHTAVSCKQIWGWLSAALFQLSNKLLDPKFFLASFGEGDSDIDWEQAYEEVKEWLKGAPPGGAPSNDDPTVVLAAYLYKNMATEATHSSLQSQVFSRTPFNAQESEGVFGDLAGAEARGSFFQLRYFATAVPYIQGMLLYLLSIAFPFFAVYLVLPSRATSFVVWCSLWVWVKSWDIGFALVYVARDIFWHLMNNRVNVFEKKINFDFPSDVLNVAFSNDPVATQSTYWVLVSALTLMVPILTAHFCMGATGMFDMFRYSIDQTANRYGQIEANVGRREVANKTEKQIDEHNHLMKFAVAKHHANRAMSQVVDSKGNVVGHAGGAQTADGYPIANQDWNKGIGHGGLMGSANARPQFTGASYMWAGHVMQNHTNLSRRDIGASLDQGAQIEAENKQANAESGDKSLAERMPNVHRGFASMHEDMGQEDMKNYQEAFEKYGEVVEGLYGKGSRQHNQAMAELETIKDTKSMKWGEFFDREGSRNNGLQDMLALQTRRRMTAVKRGEGRQTMQGLTQMRQENARSARNVLDGLNLKNIPVIGETLVNWASGGHSRPDNPGTEYNGNIFGKSQRPKIGSGPADNNVGPPPGGDGDGE